MTHYTFVTAMLPTKSYVSFIIFRFASTLRKPKREATPTERPRPSPPKILFSMVYAGLASAPIKGPNRSYGPISSRDTGSRGPESCDADGPVAVDGLEGAIPVSCNFEASENLDFQINREIQPWCASFPCPPVMNIYQGA